MWIIRTSVATPPRLAGGIDPADQRGHGGSITKKITPAVGSFP